MKRSIQNRIKSYLFFIAICFWCCGSMQIAHADQISVSTLGGTLQDWAQTIEHTSDGGYIVAGQTTSYGAGGTADVYVSKYTSTGALDTNFGVNGTRVVGGNVNSGGEVGYSIKQTSDGGYIIAGYTYGYGAGGADLYVVKLTATGALDTNFGVNGTRTIGGYYADMGYAVIQTSDGGYFVAGYTTSFGTVGYDVYAVKLTAAGALDANFGTGGTRRIGGSGDERIQSAVQSADGGYVLAGFTNTYGAGDYDVYAIKLTAAGALDTNFGVNGTRTVGGSGIDRGYAVIKTSDGGYMIVGDTTSYGSGNADMYIVKLTVAGALDTNFGVNGTRTVGGSALDYARSIVESSSGGYVVTGQTMSFGAGSNDMYIVKLTAAGTLDTNFGVNGTRTVGGSNAEYSYGVTQISNGNYVVTGITLSYGAGSFDVYNVAMGNDGVLSGCSQQSGSGGSVSNGGSIGSGGTINSSTGFSVSSGGGVSSGGIFGQQCSIVVTTVAPTVSTQTATNVTNQSAILNAVVTSAGGENPTRYIDWGTVSGSYANTCTLGVGSTGSYTCNITGLSPNTQYYFRARATNSAGTGNGTESSFVTPILNDIVIPDPTNTKVIDAVSGGYISLNSGTVTNTDMVQTEVNVTFRRTNVADVIFPVNTDVQKVGGGAFDFTSFVTSDVTSSVRQENGISLVAVKVGVPNMRLTFSKPATMLIQVGAAYNGQVLDIQYQEDGESVWYDQGVCVVANGVCSFQTTHATTYTVNGDGTASGAEQNNITTDVQDVLSMDCDQTGNINDNIVEFNELTPGTPVTASTTCTVTTNSDAGYTLSVRRNDSESTMDKDTDASTNITDRTNWNVTTPNATTWQASDTGLAFTVYTTTATKNTTWWGTGTTQADANNMYAGFPTSYTDIMQHTSYNGTATTTNIGYKLDVPTTQKSGTYAGEITYQVVTAP